MQTDFVLRTEGDRISSEQGKLSLEGKKYKVETPSQDIIFNGSTIWYYLKKEKEVQINTVTAQDKDFLTPASLFTIYERDFIYAVAEEAKENGKVVAKIEFKPRKTSKDEFF